MVLLRVRFAKMYVTPIRNVAEIFRAKNANDVAADDACHEGVQLGSAKVAYAYDGGYAVD